MITDLQGAGQAIFRRGKHIMANDPTGDIPSGRIPDEVWIVDARGRWQPVLEGYALKPGERFLSSDDLNEPRKPPEAGGNPKLVRGVQQYVRVEGMGCDYLMVPPSTKR